MTDQQTALLGPPTGASSEPPKPLTMSQALARYDATMRAKAAAAGGPTDRTTSIGMHVEGDLGRVAYTDVDGKVYVLDMRDDSAPVRLSFALLRAILADAYDTAEPSVGHHVATVFADTETLNRTAKIADTWARDRDTQEARSLARLLTFRRGLPTSVFTPVLTEALASRYWLPTGAQPDDVGAWDVAFGHGKKFASREAFSYLIGRALDGTQDANIMKSVVTGERYGSRAGQHGSDSAAVSAYSKAVTVTDAHAAMLSLDPTLRERNAISGIIAKVRIHQILDDKIEAFVDDPGKLAPGAKMLIFDGYEYGHKVEVTLRSVEFVSDALMVELSPPKRTDPHAHIIEEAKKRYQPLYIAQAPFLAIKTAPKNKRWMGIGDERGAAVEIPLDIILAGAPVGD